MDIDQFLEYMKSKGICRYDRSKCLDTFRDAGFEEAKEQADGYVERDAQQLRAAESAARRLCGMAI